MYEVYILKFYMKRQRYGFNTFKHYSKQTIIPIKYVIHFFYYFFYWKTFTNKQSNKHPKAPTSEHNIKQH